MMRILRIFENIGAANHVAVMYKAHSAIIIKMCFDLREVFKKKCEIFQIVSLKLGVDLKTVSSFLLVKVAAQGIIKAIISCLGFAPFCINCSRFMTSKTELSSTYHNYLCLLDFQ